MSARILLAALLGLSCLSTAHASVIYRWQPLSPGDKVAATRGIIEVTDAAYRDGRAEFFHENNGAPGYPYTILSASMSFDRVGHDDSGGEQAYTDLTAYGYQIFTQLDADLSLGSYLSGFLDVTGLFANFDSESNGNLWTVSDVNGDYFDGYGFCSGNYDDPCSGGTGYWVLDASTVPADVPAPAAGGLFALMIAVTVGFRRGRMGLWHQVIGRVV